MTKNELKAKLRSAWAMQKQLESNLEELERLRSKASRITPAYSLAPGGCDNAQARENTIIKYVDMETLIQSNTDKLVDALQEVHTLIELVDDPIQKLVLHKRYCNYKRWEQIAAELNYSWQHIHKLHSLALNNLLRHIENMR